MMKFLFPILALGAAALVGAGCGTSKKPLDYTPQAARFYLESASGDGTPLRLPHSGVNLAVNSKPVITEGDIANVDLVQVELGKCLYFQLTPTASRDFYRMSVTHQGRRLALVIDGVALGARRIDGPITIGVIFVFAEVPDEDLPKLVENLKKSAAALQKELSKA